MQIRADRADIGYAIGMEMLALLRPHVDLVECKTKAFRYLDGRDLTGRLNAWIIPEVRKNLTWLLSEMTMWILLAAVTMCSALCTIWRNGSNLA